MNEKLVEMVANILRHDVLYGECFHCNKADFRNKTNSTFYSHQCEQCKAGREAYDNYWYLSKELADDIAREIITLVSDEIIYALSKTMYDTAVNLSASYANKLFDTVKREFEKIKEADTDDSEIRNPEVAGDPQHQT